MRVDSYSFGQIVVAGRKYTNDVIIFPGRVKDNWWRDRGHLLQVEDLDEVFEFQPEVLVVGKGAHGKMEIDRAVRDKLEEIGIELRAAETNEAVEIYNVLAEDERKDAVAALHLTC